MTTGELRELWRETFGNSPHPKVRRELLIPILAYRLQERVFGGQKPAIIRRLRAVALGLAEKSTASFKPVAPEPGTRMVRQWQGKLHEVTTVERGFIYNGHKFRSLSEIARAITGTRWSGPAFFGLKKRKTREAA
jgi:hypothetical protein